MEQLKFEGILQAKDTVLAYCPKLLCGGFFPLFLSPVILHR